MHQDGLISLRMASGFFHLFCFGFAVLVSSKEVLNTLQELLNFENSQAVTLAGYYIELM